MEGTGQSDGTGETSDGTGELLALVRELQALVLKQNERIEGLERKLNAAGPARSRFSRSSRPFSRAQLLRTGAVATAAVVGATIVTTSAPDEVSAAPLSAEYFTAYGADPTYTPQPQVGFDASDPLSKFQVGVEGWGAQIGVYGAAGSSHGAGVYGAATSTSTRSAGVVGSARHGAGVSGQTVDGFGVAGYGSSGVGVYATSDKSSAVLGVVSARNRSAAISGVGNGTGTGVLGRSRYGRGGVFAGGTAALRLLPDYSSNTHPQSGEAGDLFVDRYHRLWYCHNGGSHARWRQLS